MRTLRILTSAALLCAPVFAAPTDTMMVRKVHTEAMKGGPVERPAKDETQTIWIAKDRVRVDSDESSVIVRIDQKKMYMLDPKEKTYSVIDMPLDMKKYLPANMAESYDKMKASFQAKVTATDETKKIKDWNAKKYEVSLSGGMGGMTEEIWTTKDISIDASAFLEMVRMRAMMMPGGDAMMDELKKLDGVPVMADRTQKTMGGAVKTHEEVVSVEQKDAPAGSFDVPKDYKEKPYDFAPKSLGGRHRPEGKPHDNGSTPPEKE